MLLCRKSDVRRQGKGVRRSLSFQVMRHSLRRHRWPFRYNRDFPIVVIHHRSRYRQWLARMLVSVGSLPGGSIMMFWCLVSRSICMDHHEYISRRKDVSYASCVDWLRMLVEDICRLASLRSVHHDLWQQVCTSRTRRHGRAAVATVTDIDIGVALRPREGEGTICISIRISSSSFCNDGDIRSALETTSARCTMYIFYDIFRSIFGYILRHLQLHVECRNC